MQKSEVINKLKDIKPELQEKYSISQIGLFGSYVRNEQNDDSDIDILVEFSQKTSLFKFSEFINYLQDLFSQKVDVANKNNLRPEISQRILSEVQYI